MGLKTMIATLHPRIHRHLQAIVLQRQYMHLIVEYAMALENAEPVKERDIIIIH